MARRTLLALIAVLALVPIASGAAGIILGPTALPGGEAVNATVDSEYRFVNVFWLAAGVILLWSLRRADERATVTRVVLGIAAAGGIARLISAWATGWPHSVFVGTIVLELVVVPLVLLWHARTIGRRASEAGRARP